MPGEKTMTKHLHEIRDPIHTFIHLDTDERTALDSPAFQRLRHIHQLALSHLVYPGATHTRFEHSLGTMELASRVFDVVTAPLAVHNDIGELMPELSRPDPLAYWRRVVRIAALYHDIGHLPFSHAAEKKLLPTGWNHEKLTVEIIESDEMQGIWNKMIPPLRSEHIAKIAVGKKILKDKPFSDWEAVLSDIITGDAFGVDRMDYLLRDSHHAGVAYGRFDYSRLLDTLRILPSPDSKEPSLGVEVGGIQSAEALLLARYFMYSQVYFHPVRRMYDRHLTDFLKEWLPHGKFLPSDKGMTDLTDIEVTNGIFQAARNNNCRGHHAAKRMMERKHFRIVYSGNLDDAKIYPDPGRAIYEGLCAEIGSGLVIHDSYVDWGGSFDFPVLDRDERIVSSTAVSDILAKIPHVAVDNVCVDPEKAEYSKDWLKCNRDRILREYAEREEDE